MSSTKARRTVLVLGGGVEGLVTANELRRRLDPADRGVVVERERRHLFQLSLGGRLERRLEQAGLLVGCRLAGLPVTLE